MSVTPQATAVNPDLARELLERHKPQIYYDSFEPYVATPVEAFLSLGEGASGTGDRCALYVDDGRGHLPMLFAESASAQVSGWLGGRYGCAGGGAASTGVVAKGIVVVAAATTAVGGGIALEHKTHRRPPKAATAVQSRVAAKPTPTATSPAVPRAGTSVAKRATRASASAAKKAKPAVPSKPEAEFAPAPSTSGGPAPRRTLSQSINSKAAAEFTPEPGGPPRMPEREPMACDARS